MSSSQFSCPPQGLLIFFLCFAFGWKCLSPCPHPCPVLSPGAAVVCPGVLRVFYFFGAFHQIPSQVFCNFLSLAVIEDLYRFQKNFWKVLQVKDIIFLRNLPNSSFLFKKLKYLRVLCIFYDINSRVLVQTLVAFERGCSHSIFHDFVNILLETTYVFQTGILKF